MNKVVLIGRLTADPETTNTANTCISRYTLAVDRKRNKDGESQTDFIRCVTFGKTAEFVRDYLHKGSKIAAFGRIQTGSYTNKDGQKVYTTDVVVEEHEFAESRSGSQGQQPSFAQAPAMDQGSFPPQGSAVQASNAAWGGTNGMYGNMQPGSNNASVFPPYGQNMQPAPNPFPAPSVPDSNGFMSIPDGIDETLPFN